MMQKLLPFLLTVFFWVKSCFAVILVQPQEGEWQTVEKVSLFQLVENHTLILKDIDPTLAQQFVESGLSEKDFLSNKIAQNFPGKRFLIHDVPATMVDLVVLNRDLFKKVPADVFTHREYNDWDLPQKAFFFFDVTNFVTVHLLDDQPLEDKLHFLLGGMVESVAQKSGGDLLRTTKFDVLKEAVEREYQAIQNNQFIFFRGTNGVVINGLRLIDCSVDTHNLQVIHQIPTREFYCLMRAFSYGASLLGGFLRDPKACAFEYMAKYCDYGYSLALEKPYFFSPLGRKLWCMPRVHPVFQVLAEGEAFHPRTNGSILDGPNYTNIPYDKNWDYKALAIHMSELLHTRSNLLTRYKNLVTSDTHGQEKENLRQAHADLLQCF